MKQYFLEGPLLRMFEGNVVPEFSTSIPPKVYTVDILEDPPFFRLRVTEGFDAEEVFYGDDSISDIIIADFNQSTKSIGALFEGSIGTGKTKRVKSLIKKGLEGGIATILVERPINFFDFKMFIESLTSPTIIVFDEFDKIYERLTAQTGLLNLLDGVTNTKNLFLIICNDVSKLTYGLEDRTKRLKYRIYHREVTEKVIKDYCKDNLDNPEHLQSILSLKDLLDERFSFDILHTVVENANLVKQDPTEFIDNLNIKVASPKGTYFVEVENTDPKVSFQCTNGSQLISIGEYSGEYSISERIIVKFLTEDKDYWEKLMKNDHQFNTGPFPFDPNPIGAAKEKISMTPMSCQVRITDDNLVTWNQQRLEFQIGPLKVSLDKSPSKELRWSKLIERININK